MSFSKLIPEHYLKLIDFKNPKDPLYLMSVPSKKENICKPHELSDPIADKLHEKTPGLIHRYPDRVLLKVTNNCAIHCRFCFRKNILDKSTFDLKKAITYIKKHKEVWEVILSGGDPLILSDKEIQKIFAELSKIPHIKAIRIHTRVPAVVPQRITKKLIETLTNTKTTHALKSQKIIFVIHINHPREITKELASIVSKLTVKNIMTLSQSVLLKGINDSAKTLSALFRQLVQIGVKPYYLHQLDPASGTSHFAVPLPKARRIYNSLRGHLSGICIPEFMIEQPKGKGKIPVMWYNQKHKGKAFNQTKKCQMKSQCKPTFRQT